MIKKIIDILEETDGLSAWKIVETKTDSSELFFIKKDLDMNRTKSVKHYNVAVYKDFKEDGVNYRGSFNARIHPTMKDDEIQKAISDALFAAGFAKNKTYPIAKPVNNEEQLAESSFASGSLGEWTARITDTIYKADVLEKGHINSAELFLNRYNKRIVNSEGVDVSYRSYQGELEFITNWQEEGEEIELYDKMDFADFDSDSITAEVDQLLKLSREKALAGMTLNLQNHTVLLTGEPVKEFIKYYYQQSNTKNVYEQISTARIDESLQGKDVKGDYINLKLDPFMDNSTLSAPYDEDGYPLKHVTVIKEGILQRYWGKLRYSHYLDVEPTGEIQNITVDTGSKTIDEMKKDPYLELLAFSHFQMDPLTGNFGGEIRLGRYYDGKKVIPVTGGSISGNIKEVQQHMYLSKEGQKKNNFTGPETIQLFDVSVAGS